MRTKETRHAAYVDRKVAEAVELSKRVQLTPAVGGKLVATVPSLSHPGDEYYIAVNKKTWRAVGTCQCGAAIRHGDCKHKLAVDMALEQKRERLVVTFSCMWCGDLLEQAQTEPIRVLTVSGHAFTETTEGFISKQQVDVVTWLGGRVVDPGVSIVGIDGQVYTPIDGFWTLVIMEMQ